MCFNYEQSKKDTDEKIFNISPGDFNEPGHEGAKQPFAIVSAI